MTRWLLEADDGTLTRGRAYAREGRVDAVRRSGGQLLAVADGGDDRGLGAHSWTRSAPAIRSGVAAALMKSSKPPRS